MVIGHCIFQTEHAFRLSALSTMYEKTTTLSITFILKIINVSKHLLDNGFNYGLSVGIQFQLGFDHLNFRLRYVNGKRLFYTLRSNKILSLFFFIEIVQSELTKVQIYA